MFGFLKRLFGQADLNKDGQVDAKDVKIAVESVAAKAETAVTKVKKQAKTGAGKAKIARARKPKPKA